MPFSTTSRSLEFSKIALPAVLAVLLVAGAMFGLFLPQYRQSLLDGKKQMIRELVYSVWHMLEHIHLEEMEGKYTREEAQHLAMEHLRGMRYGEDSKIGEQGKDYFWINDFSPAMIMHPYRPDLEGKDLSSFADPDGSYLFLEFIKTASRDGEGFVPYKWQWKDDSTRIVPKLSFVKEFKPWGWIVGTGIYLEDVQAGIDLLTSRLAITFLGIFSCVILLTAIQVLRALRLADQRRQAVAELRAHQDSLEETVRQRTDELRQANETLNHEVRERKNAERTTREQLHFLQDLVDAIPNPVYFKNAEGLYTGCNTAFELFTGLSRQTILGRAAVTTQSAPWDENDPGLLAIPGSSSYEATTIDAAGKQHEVIISAATFATTAGDLGGLVVTIQDITKRRLAEKEKEKLILDLQKSLAEIRTLSGLLPICAHCKKIRDDSGYWKKIETYIQAHSKAEFSHSICPECADKYYPEYDLYDKKNP